MNRRQFEHNPERSDFQPFFEDEETMPRSEGSHRSRLNGKESVKIHFDERRTKRSWYAAAPAETQAADLEFEKRTSGIELKRITIIGSGASGTLLAVNLLRAARHQSLEINLVEKKNKIGPGLAYASESNCHLLNIPADQMSAFPNDAGHFSRWLAANDYDYRPTDFVPRRIYGEYLREILAEAIEKKSSSVKINLIDDEAVDLLSDEDGTMVILKSGEILFSHKVVLAFGNLTPPAPPVKDLSFTESDKYFKNPWEPDMFEKIRPQDAVLIIGTGLSMVDVALSFHQHSHLGKIFAISTHGLLPAVHRFGRELPPFNGEITEQFKIAGVMKILREKIRQNEVAGGDWQAVVDALRPATQKVWLNLDETEKRKFLRHGRRFWNVSRHRMPASCASVIEEMQAWKQLHLKKGRLQEINLTDDGTFRVNFTADGLKNIISVDAVINCTGAETDFEKIELPLVKNLLAEGLIAADDLRLGIKALPDGRTLNKFGSVSNKLFAIGSLLKGVLWESTAIPEIRNQARELAVNLLD